MLSQNIGSEMVSSIALTELAPPVPLAKYLYKVLFSADEVRCWTKPQTVLPWANVSKSVDKVPENQSAFDATTSNSTVYAGDNCPSK